MEPENLTGAATDNVAKLNSGFDPAMLKTVIITPMEALQILTGWIGKNSYHSMFSCLCVFLPMPFLKYLY